MRQMPFTTPDGAEHPEAIWDLVALVAAPHGQPPMLRLQFAAWHDLGALAAGRSPLAGAEKNYEMTGEAFSLAVGQQIGAASPAASIGSVVLAAAWQIALLTLDTPAPTEQEPERKASFFADSIDVQA